MSAGRPAGLALALAALLSAVPSSLASAEADQGGLQAIVFVLHPASFESVMAVPEFRQLARPGGVGLMTTRAPVDGRNAGTRVLSTGSTDAAADPSVLSRLLAARRISLCESVASFRGALGARALAEEPRLLPGSPADGCPPPIQPGQRLQTLAVIHLLVPAPGVPGAERVLRTAGAFVRSTLRPYGDATTMVVVVEPDPSRAMSDVGDEVTPLIMAEGSAGGLLRGNGPLHALTSDTTRQDGLVANVDVAPTILRFFGVPVPSSMDGEPLRVTDAPAPFGLHRRHLEARAIRFPVQLAELAFVVLAAMVGFALLSVQRRWGTLPPPVAVGMRFVAVCVVATPLMALAGGSLPRATWAWVGPFLVLGIPAVAALSVLAGRGRGPMGPLVLLGWVGLGFLALDAVMGGPSFRTPLFGGTMFDGARFYGLPNGFLCLILGSSLFAASTLTPLRGFLLLVAAALFAGFPSLGADVGGAVALFFAAGLWWVLRTRRRLGLPEGALVAALAVVGLGAVLVANRVLPGAPTHATRFVERTGGHAGSVVDTVVHRLGIGWHMIATVPAAILPLVGFVIVFVLVARRTGPIGEGLALDRSGAWRHVLMVLCAAALVAYVVNDTGAAAADPVFVYAAAGMVYPAMLTAAKRRVAPSPADRAPVGGSGG